MKFKQAVKVGVGTGLVSDDLTLLALAQRWPVATWFNWKVRNLSDDHLRRIAATSGLIGVGF
ncbi:MAG: hypothetical protein DKINENOH_00813 [bacterium]|nr:hypothetical protein [bacterium]